MKFLSEYLIESLKVSKKLMPYNGPKEKDFENLDEIGKRIEDVFAGFANDKYKNELSGKSFDSKAFIGELQRLGFSEKELIEYFNYVNDTNDWEDCICPYKFDGDEIELADQLSSSIDTNDNN